MHRGILRSNARLGGMHTKPVPSRNPNVEVPAPDFGQGSVEDRRHQDNAVVAKFAVYPVKCEEKRGGRLQSNIWPMRSLLDLGQELSPDVPCTP